MSRDLNIIKARSFVNIMSVRAKEQPYIDNLDNVYDQLIYLENWRAKAIKMLNEKEQELRRRSVTIQNLSSEVSILKNDLDGLEMGISALEEENRNLKQQLIDKL